MEEQILIPFSRPFVPNSPLVDENLSIFAGHNKSINRVVRSLSSSPQSHHIITGYHGAGKTSFVQRVIPEWYNFLISQDVKALIFYLKLSKFQPSEQIAKKLIGNVYFNHKDDFSSNEELIELLKSSHVRSQADTVKEVKTDKKMKRKENDLALFPISKLKFSISRKGSEEEKQSLEITHCKYTIDSALDDFEKAMHLLTRPSKEKPNFIQKIFKKQECVRSCHVLIVIDHIDNLSNIQELSDLFDIPNVSFIIIGNIELQENIEKSKSESTSDILEKFQIEYIPCQWDQAEKFLSTVISKKSMSVELYNNYRDYLNFYSKGLPRHFFSGIYKHTKKDSNNIFCLSLDESDIKEVELYAKLHQILWNNRKKILGKRIDNVEYFSFDRSLRSIYLLTDRLFHIPNFTFEEVEKIFHLFPDSKVHRNSKKVINTLFEILINEGLLNVNENGYRLSDKTLEDLNSIPNWLKDGFMDENIFSIDFDTQLLSINDRPFSWKNPEPLLEYPVELLSTIIQNHNISIIENPDVFRGLLKDYYQGKYKREFTILMRSVEEKVPQDLLLNKGSIPAPVLSGQFIQKLDNCGFTHNLSIWAVQAWVKVLGIP